VRNQAYEASQPSMHVNDIQVNKQIFFVIFQSLQHALFLSSFSFQGVKM